MKTNRVCKICGKAYYYCAACDQAQAGKQGYEPWHILVHDENCHKIFDTLQRHFTKEYTDEQAREILKTCNLSVIEGGPDNIKRQITSIMDVKEAVETMADTEPDEAAVVIRTRKPRAKKVIEE